MKAFVTEGRRRDRLNPPIIFSVSFSFLLSSFFRRPFLFSEDLFFFQKAFFFQKIIPFFRRLKPYQSNHDYAMLPETIFFRTFLSSWISRNSYTLQKFITLD